MSGGSTIVEFWRKEDAVDSHVTSQDDVLLLDTPDYGGDDGADPADGSGAAGTLKRTRILLGLCAVAWLALCAFAIFAGGQPAPTLAAIPALVATVAVPLALLALVYILLTRNSRTEERRYADTSRALRVEAELLELRLARITDQLEAARRTLHDQADLLESYGAAASSNLEASAELITARAATTLERTSIAERAGSLLADRMDTLIAAFPDLEERAGRLAAQLMDDGHAVAERIDMLEARLQSLTELSDDARSRTLAATKSLTTQLNQVQEATRATTDELNGMAEVAASRVDICLDGARTLLDETGRSLDAQSITLDGIVTRARNQLAEVGIAVVERLNDGFDGIDSRATAIDSMLGAHQDKVERINTALESGIAVVEQRFDALETASLARSERLSDALARLTSETQNVDRALASGGLTAEKLIGCAETLLVALDSGVRELDETYPAALVRFDDRIGQTRAQVSGMGPELERLEAIAQSMLGQSHEMGDILSGQGKQLNQWLETSEVGINANRRMIQDLRVALDEIEGSATRITEGAGPLLITALLRVKDTADQAAERARQALGRAIPDAAQALGDASEEAVRKVVDDRVAAQVEKLSAIADEAVRVAHQAADRLTHQLVSISETSAAIDRKIADAEQASETRERDGFARRSALLIESLNSTAIDVAKLLSNDVTDSAWAAYLKGDRGVFTRRAVKLLDAGESREIAQHYDLDDEFRDHVNRYIHDFEAMLRIILAARDGNALGVAILSSDMGKLYVALAQAIERLRH